MSKLFSSFLKGGSTLKGKNLLPRVDPFSEGDWYANMQTGMSQSCFP